MPKIASLEPIRRQKHWFELRFDNSLSFKVNDELILKYMLKVGRSLTKSEAEKLRNEADYLFLKKKAFDILSRRRISEKELRLKLRSERKFSYHTDKVINDLKNIGLIDDLAFASSVINSSLLRGPKSRMYIRQKLYQKGIPKEIAEKAIESELAGYDESQAALDLARKKYETVKSLPTLKAKKRITDFLRGRGFSWDIINYCLNSIFIEES
jgi:regulatory protein